MLGLARSPIKRYGHFGGEAYEAQTIMGDILVVDNTCQQHIVKSIEGQELHCPIPQTMH